MKKQKPGSIVWTDLTVPNADAVRDFYSAVVGWKAVGCDMGGYEDYVMIPAGGRKVAGGICHARGVNAKIPAQWLVYITVADLRKSLKACVAKGGKVVAPARSMGGGRMAIVRDPAGAVAALFQLAKGK